MNSFLSLFILWGAERARTGEGQRERERERERERGRERKSQANSMLPAQSPVWGLIPWTVRSWPELKSRVGRLTDWATQVPLIWVTFWESFIQLHAQKQFFNVSILRALLGKMKQVEVYLSQLDYWLKTFYSIMFFVPPKNYSLNLTYFNVLDKQI